MDLQDATLLSITAFFTAIYLLLPIIIYGTFWPIILTLPACIFFFILSYHSEWKKLAKKHGHSVPSKLHIVEAELFGLVILGNAIPLIIFWLLTFIPIQLLPSQELILPTLVVVGILFGGSNFEILGEATARFLFIGE